MKIILLLLLASCAHHSPIVREKLSNNPKLCIFGDSGTDNFIQAAVAKKMAAEKCDSLHVVGDIIYPSGISSPHDSQVESKFMKYYRPILEQSQKPTIKLVMGNHDHRSSITAWQDVSKKYTTIVFPHSYYLNQINDLCIVHIDTNLYRGSLSFFHGYAQSRWLKELQENELKSCKVKIALGHHPYKSRGKHHGDAKGDMKEALERDVIGKFDWFIAGHEHIQSDEGTVNGTRLIVTGAAGKPDMGEKGGYIVWQNGQVTFQTVEDQHEGFR